MCIKLIADEETSKALAKSLRAHCAPFPVDGATGCVLQVFLHKDLVEFNNLQDDNLVSSCPHSLPSIEALK